MLTLKIVTTVLLGLKVLVGWLGLLAKIFQIENEGAEVRPSLGLVYILAIVTVWVV